MKKRSANAPFVVRKERTKPGDRTIGEVAREIDETRMRVRRVIAVLGLPVSKVGVAVLVGRKEFEKIRAACATSELRRGPRRFRNRPHPYKD